MGYFYKARIICQKPMYEELMAEFSVYKDFYGIPDRVKMFSNWCYIIEWDNIENANDVANHIFKMASSHEDDSNASEYSFKFLSEGEELGDYREDLYLLGDAEGDYSLYDEFYFAYHEPSNLKEINYEEAE